MAVYKPQSIVCLLLLLTIFLVYIGAQLFSIILTHLHRNGTRTVGSNWVVRLSLNLLGYATIFLPGFAMYQYVKKSKFAEKSDRNFFSNLLRECFIGPDKKGYSNLDLRNASQQESKSFFQDATRLLFCAFGLLVSYLIWGLIQEKIMTQKYVNTEGNSRKFQDSQFLVFVNRILAFVLSGTCLLVLHQPQHTVPFYKYIYCSFSNIMSSWCQYEALKFISFPTQVLAKASKIIPVMLMGKLAFKKKFEYYEYIIAVTICIGMTMFLTGSADVTKDDQTVTTFSGIILLIGYMVFDSFTSNWQSELFVNYSVSSLQMMCGVNFFSCLLTTVSLLQQDGFTESLYFIVKFPSFAVDCVLLSICSAVGQLFIFYTISSYGPVVFVIIMTVRQIIAIILSCLTYHHEMNIIGIIGTFVVFSAIFFRIYVGQRIKMSRKKSQNSSSV